MIDLKTFIQEYLNNEGKLDCKDAYKISAKTKTSIGEVGQCAKDLDIRISGCELGQFGKLRGTGEYNQEADEKLKPFVNDENRITCKDARAQAGGIGLKNIRGTLKENNTDVTFCELGCFKEKKRSRLYLKTKTWIENESGELLFGKGKTEVLEHIETEGSIAKAAEKLGMNYKKAWTHVKILQKNLDDVLVESHKGGGEQGGSRLTPKADEFIKNYKKLQHEIEEYANERFKELFLKPRNKKEFK
ncbi:winged helix-turn-helix domain-containing protein [Sulfurospirillum arcachonense]|uniref:winged helix-turn-helix domain-containing protein n=1 Tax=Sulfurospirillum arcachonense TaxID=57666 RepID=UPI000468C161|nr:winged helix-turn-helix domain-containing protein [Sulfurospirillum arcachonense]